MSSGLVHIYCGNGKGKTTAALGLAVRALGNGQKVMIVQFLKSRVSGEVIAFQNMPEVTLLRGKESNKFSWQMNEQEKQHTRNLHEELLESVKAQLATTSYGLLVLDEALGACNAELLSEDALIELLQGRPDNLEVVVTGRNPSERLLEMADYITEMCAIKHPYEKGVAARKGVEY